MASTMNGTVFKRCGCTETYTRPDGTPAHRQLGQARPKLHTRDGRWAREHGTWRFQLEVPLTDGGPREHLRGNYPTEPDTRTALTAVIDLLRLADGTEDPNAQRRAITALIHDRLASKAPLPDADEVCKKLTLGQAVDNPLTVGQYLTEWLATKADLAGGDFVTNTGARSSRLPLISLSHRPDDTSDGLNH